MAKYELSDSQAKQLLSILNAATIKGENAEILVELKKAVSTPVQEKPERPPGK